MANQTQDVELRIRASNYSKKTTDQVVDALKQLTGAQNAQIESAKKGTGTAAQLEQAYLKIESAAKALLGQNSLIKLFQSQSQSVTDLEAKLTSARKAQQDYIATSSKAAQQGMAYREFTSQRMAEYTKSEGGHAAAMARISKEWTEYKATLDASGKSQAQSAAEAKKLAAAVASAEKELARAQGRIDTTQKRLSEFGITAANASEQQQKITTSVNDANAALARQEQAIGKTDAWAAQRRAQEQAIAQREQQVKVDNVFAAAERDVAASLDAERKAQAAANLAANDKSRERQVEVDILFAQAQRDAAEALNKKTAALNAQKAALQAAANEAERMTRASNNTSRGSAPVSTPNLAGQIRDIQSPNDAAARTIAGVEAMIGKLETRVTQIRGPIKDYKGAVEEATRAQKALLALAGSVDAYQRQIAAVQAARGEFVAARGDVNRLIAELRSGNAGDDVTTRLARAQNILQQSAQRLGNLTTAARQMRGELTAAGVDTNNLTNAEQALVAQANRATAAVNTLNDAHRRLGAAADNSGKRIWDWFGGGNRTSLSYMQRMRGELLGLATGYIGLNAAIGVANKSLDAYKNRQAILSRLTIVTGGDTRKAAEEFKYLQMQADRIGFVFEKTAPAYAKFAIAAKSAGMDGQQTRFMFENIAGAATKARLSTDELEGVLKAFEQMLSKGTIQAEELKGQLGDRLPGAFQIAARAMNMEVEEFTKKVTEGKVTSTDVLKITRQLAKEYGVAQGAQEGLLQSQARFANATDRFLSNTAQGGFVQSYERLLKQLTEMMNNGQADKLAAQLSAGFSAVIQVLGFVADNIDGVKLAVGALIGLNFIKWLMTLPTLIAAVRTELVLANTNMAVFQGWLGRQQAAAALATTLGATGLTGVVARLTPVLTGAATAMIALSRAIPYIGLAIMAAEAINFAIDKWDEKQSEVISRVLANARRASNAAAEAAKKAQEAIGTSEEDAARKRAQKMTTIARDALLERQRVIEEARAKGQKIGKLMESETALDKADAAASGGATADPGDPNGDRARIIQLEKKLTADQLKNERQYRQERLRTEKGDLAARLDIIKEPFDEMRKEFAESVQDKKKQAAAFAKIDAAYANAAKLERLKYANEQAKSGESAAKKRATLVEEISNRIKEANDDIANRTAEQDPTLPFAERMDARVKDVSNAYDKLQEKIAKLRPLDSKQAADYDATLAKLKAQRVEVEKTNSKRDEANRLVDVFNKKQGELAAMIDAVKAKEEAGSILPENAVSEINGLIASLGPGVEEAGQAALEFATNMHAALDPTRLAEIVATVSRGLAQNNVDGRIIANQANEAQRQMNELLAQQQREIDVVNQKRQLGSIDADKQADQINAINAKYAQGLLFSAQQLQMFIDIARQYGGLTEEELRVLEAAVTNVTNKVKSGILMSKEWEKTIVNSVAQNGTNAFDQMAQSIAKVIDGQQGVGEGFKGMLQAAGTFFASVMRDLALMIVRIQILNFLKNMGGGVGAAADVALKAYGQHNGGVTGYGPTFTRSVPAEAFLGAIRYHTGGIAGFAPNEVPAVLQKGEEVLTRNDPRHVLNGGASGGENSSQRFVLVDDRKGVAEAMASAQGEKAILVHLKNNLPTIKQWIGTRK